MPTFQDLQFLRQGRWVTCKQVSADRTLLDLLREDLGTTGSKEGCGGGDCGACMVVLAELHDGALRWRSVNACIALAHSVHGKALWTVEDLRSSDGGLHPVQQALLEHHGSQCGFCTPGIVMSLFGLYQALGAAGGGVAQVTREQAQVALSGNLCRCTGYRPILDAAQALPTYPAPPFDSAGLVAQLRAFAAPGDSAPASEAAYLRPHTLDALLRARAADPQAQLIAGATDAGLWLTRHLRQFERVIDLTGVAELRRCETRPGWLRLGAGLSIDDSFAALVEERPQLRAFWHRFASEPVRRSATLGGNIANGSPIGDTMPLLLALGAELELGCHDGAQALRRRLSLAEFYTGYRRNQMAPDEVIIAVEVPRPHPDERCWAYKVSKRFEDDISAVCLALWLRVRDGRISAVRLGVGGMAATVARAPRTEAALLGQDWSAATMTAAQTVLHDEFAPLSDMRASAGYRKQVLAQLLQRCWLDSTGAEPLDVFKLQAVEVAP